MYTELYSYSVYGWLADSSLYTLIRVKTTTSVYVVLSVCWPAVGAYVGQLSIELLISFLSVQHWSTTHCAQITNMVE